MKPIIVGTIAIKIPFLRPRESETKPLKMLPNGCEMCSKVAVKSKQTIK